MHVKRSSSQHLARLLIRLSRWGRWSFFPSSRTQRLLSLCARKWTDDHPTACHTRWRNSNRIARSCPSRVAPLRSPIDCVRTCRCRTRHRQSQRRRKPTRRWNLSRQSSSRRSGMPCVASHPSDRQPRSATCSSSVAGSTTSSDRGTQASMPICSRSASTIAAPRGGGLRYVPSPAGGPFFTPRNSKIDTAPREPVADTCDPFGR